MLFFAAWKAIIRSPKGRAAVDAFKLKMPIFGNIINKSAISRFCRTLGTLIASGVPILEALKIVKDAIGNMVIANAIEEVHGSIREGETIADPLRASGVFDDLIVNMIDVGEETGELDKMLIKIADNYENDVDVAVEGLSSLLEP
jgi:type IV pilus assembly protein PilC